MSILSFFTFCCVLFLFCTQFCWFWNPSLQKGLAGWLTDVFSHNLFTNLSKSANTELYESSARTSEMPRILIEIRYHSTNKVLIKCYRRVSYKMAKCKLLATIPHKNGETHLFHLPPLNVVRWRKAKIWVFAAAKLS